MSSIVTSTRRLGLDHFEPEAALDAQEARHLRGYLEHIDLTAFAANQATLKGTLGEADQRHFEMLAIAAARARAHWVGAALAMTETAQPTPEQTATLTKLRESYEELSDAYQGLRRMVERGYLHYRPKA